MTSSANARKRPSTAWGRGVEAALIRARQRALAEARRTGVPIVSMVDGQLVEFHGTEDEEASPLAGS